MQKAIMMVGLPGSGKSTYIRENLITEENKLTTKIFSSDDYRLRLCGDVNCQTKNDLVFSTLYKELAIDLALGYNVIFDATNTTLKSRKRFLDIVNKIDNLEKICYIANTSVIKCIERDAHRDRTVGEAVIRKFEAGFQLPQFYEGWDDIILINFDEANYYTDANLDQLEYVLEAMQNFNQANPHHRYTVGEHCWNMHNYVKLNDPIRAIAGKFHDIGKIFTQRFDEWDIAHYYGHDAVGTYYLISHPYLLPPTLSKTEFFEVLFYINWHMRAHGDLDSESAKRKYIRLFGEDRFNKLIEFGKADNIASGCDGKYSQIKQFIENLKATGSKYKGELF